LTKQNNHVNIIVRIKPHYIYLKELLLWKSLKNYH